MNDIMLLTKCELIKYFKMKFITVGILLVVSIMGIITFNEYQDMKIYRNSIYSGKETSTWQEREEKIIEYGTESLKDPWYDDIQRDQISRRIEVAKYNLENNISREIYKNIWWFFNDNTFEWVIRLLVILTVFAGSINIGQEYSKKTINQMLLLPYNRGKILLSKYLAMLIYGLMLFSLIFVLGIISGIIIHGFEGMNSLIVLNNTGSITTMSMTTYSLTIVLFKLVELIFFIALTGMIAVVFKSGSVASVIGVLTASIGTPVFLFLSKYYEIINYLPLNNLDFRRYLDFGRTMPIINDSFTSVVIQGITPVTSSIIVISSIALLVAIAFVIFKKSDIK